MGQLEFDIQATVFHFPETGKPETDGSTPMKRAESLRPGDIPVALRLAQAPSDGYAHMSEALEISTGAAHRAVRRLEKAGLIVPQERRVIRGPLEKFIIYGLRHAFFAEPGKDTVGVPTAHSAPPLSDEFAGGPTFVWSTVRGSVRGFSVQPLYPQAPGLARSNQELYEALALIDALRVGQARERRAAERFISELLESWHQRSMR